MRVDQSVMKIHPPVWFPDRDMSGLRSVSQDDVEAFNVIREKTEAPAEHPVASSLDVTPEMDVGTDSSGGEHSPLRQHLVPLQWKTIMNYIRYDFMNLTSKL